MRLLRLRSPELAAEALFGRLGGRKLRLAVLLLGALFVITAAPAGAADPAPSVIYVISNGWHTEIGVPAERLTGPLALLGPAFPGARYLVFGWGQRAFYMAARPTWTEALRALLPAPSVVLVLGLGESPLHAFIGDVHVVALPVTQDGWSNLTAFLWQSFAETRVARPERIAAGPYPASAFYASSSTYDGAHTCNTWTAEALHAAGLPIGADGVVFASQVMRQVRHLAARTDTARSELQGRLAQ